MIKLFGQTDTVFSTNGDMTIRPLRANVHKEDNGDFYLDLDAAVSYADYLTVGRILVCPTPQGDQAFRIASVTKGKQKISLRAWHLFYDSKNYVIADTNIVNKSCNDALDQINNHTDITSPFTTLSNVGTVNSYRCVRKSLHEAIRTVIERWGGHLVRNNWNISLLASVGQDNGVTVRYGKNIKDISVEENWDDVVTKILPVGKDGILLNDQDPPNSIYVTADISYPIPYTKTITFDQQEIEEDQYSTETEYRAALVQDLYDKAVAYLDQYSVPRVNYTLKANLERITDVGDTVEVIDERLGVNILTNVIVYDYDVILGQYTSVEFGNFRRTLESLMSTISAQTEAQIVEATDSVKVTLGQELSEATAQIWSALGDSNVIYNGDSIMVVDALPATDATNVMLINAGGIGFSQTGITGTFSSAWTIDGTLDMSQINVINLVADMIKGGTLKLGSQSNQSGILEVYDEQNNLVCNIDKDGIKVFGEGGAYVLINNQVGFAGFDKNDEKIYWVSEDEFHMKKGVMEQEITLCNKLRFIPIEIYSGSTLVNDGIGLVSVSSD